MPAIFPISVDMPVVTTTAEPLPAAITVPACTSESRSPSEVAAGRGSAGDLSTGMLSPVSADSWTESPKASISRASAGTWSPASSSIRSPGTTSRVGIDAGVPSRTTRASGAAMRCSAAKAFCARSSCRKPMMALTSTIATIAAASAQSPMAPAITAATTRIQMTSSLNWRRKVRHQGRGGGSLSTFGPWSVSRRVASADVSPRTSVPRRVTTPSRSMACHSTGGRAGGSRGPALVAIMGLAAFIVRPRGRSLAIAPHSR